MLPFDNGQNESRYRFKRISERGKNIETLKNHKTKCMIMFLKKSYTNNLCFQRHTPDDDDDDKKKKSPCIQGESRISV